MSAAKRERKGGSTWSIVHYGSCTQFIVAVLLASVIPVLAILYLVASSAIGIEPTQAQLWAIGGVVGFLAVCGYAIIFKYPVNILRLRQHLETLAGGGLPRNVRLSGEEDDLIAIERDMKTIVDKTEERIRTIESQTQTLLAAERQRVMIESLGAACHHLGQPATVISAYLEMLNRQASTEETHEIVDQCSRASEAISDILHRLQSVAEYRTEPYLVTREGNRTITSESILSI